MAILVDPIAERKRRAAATNSTAILGQPTTATKTVAPTTAAAPKPTATSGKVGAAMPTTVAPRPAATPVPMPGVSATRPPPTAPAVSPTTTAGRATPTPSITRTPTNNIPTAPTGSTSTGMATGGGGGGINVVGPGNRAETGSGSRTGMVTSPIPNRFAGGGSYNPTPTGTGVMGSQIESEQRVDINPTINEGRNVPPAAGLPPAPTRGSGGRGANDLLHAITGAEDPKGIDPSNNQSIDDLIEGHIRSTLQGNGDSLEEENALRQQQSDRLLGRGLVNQRASMGRAGFASSGALGAMEGDLRSKAAMDLASTMIDSREREQNQTFGQKQGVTGSDIAMREAANREAILKAQADALRAILGDGGGDTAPEAPSGGGGGLGGALDDAGRTIGGVTGIDGGTSVFGKGTDQTELAASPDEAPVSLADDPSKALVTTRAGAGADARFAEVYTDPQGQQWDVYVRPDGTRVRVKRATQGTR